MQMLGERRALSLLPLSFFGLLFLLSALAGDPAWTRVAIGLASVYLIAFFAVAAGWFWGRWVAVGLGTSGAISGIFGLVQQGFSWPLALYTIFHGAMALPLLGKEMAEQYELAPAAKARLKMADNDIRRLGKAVSRAAGSLPFLIIFVFGPRPEPELLALGLGAFGLAVLSLLGLLRLRAWAVLGLGAAAAATLLTYAMTPAWALGVHAFQRECGLSTSWLPAGPTLGTSALAASLLLATAFAPFARAMVRYLRGR